MPIEALTVEQPVHAEKLLNVSHCVLLRIPGGVGNSSPDQRVSAIDERQRGENRLRLTKFKMHTRHSAPLHGIVHAGKVVEDKRCGVEVFDDLPCMDNAME